MSLDRALPLHTAALVILGAVFVGHPQDAVVVPALTAVAAVVAIAVNDILGWLRLKPWVANLLAVIAAVWSLLNLFENPDITSEKVLLAMSDILCYTQIVLLFQEKSLRVYWLLIVLSILQVMVAAARDLGSEFGLLLGGYALIALSTLFLLCVFREVRTIAKAPATAGQKRLAGRQLLLAPPEVAPPAMTDEQLRRFLPVGILVRQVVLLSVATLLFAVAFFYATPRLSDSSWLGGRSQGAGTSGFQPKVRLAERGRIHLSSQVVMRVAMSRMSDRRPVFLVGEPYFHGEVLTEYKHDELGGTWHPRRPTIVSSNGGRRGSWQSAPQTTTNLVRQDITLEATAGNRRFEIVPTQPLSDYSIGTYGPGSRSQSDGNAPRRHKRYSVATPAIVSNRQLHAIPHPNRLLNDFDRAAMSEEEVLTTTFEANRFLRLTETAASVLAQQKLQDATSLDKALALERHFLSPDLYHYSLHLNFTRDPNLDPIEDFVANHRTGHCEYFASALVLMLRSQGIPARMILGYKGGAFNSVGNYYVVQQRHAHAWVEAWIHTEEVPPGEIAGPPSEAGAWYRLDPTPGRDLYVTLDEQGVGNRLAQAFDYVELLWRDYVLSLNKNRQDDIVYVPLTEKANIIPSWVEQRTMRRWLDRMSRQMGLDFTLGQARGGRPAFEGSLAIVVIAALLVLVGLFHLARLAAWTIGRWLSAAPSRVGSHSPAFYRRLERLLARLPAIRQSGQTPRELAAVAGQQLADASGPIAVAAVPAEVVSAYYRVRFGGDRLDKNEMDGIEQALDRLGRAITKRHENRNRRLPRSGQEHAVSLADGDRT